MSLGVAFKGPEGIVLAVDSRVTLFTKIRDSAGNEVNLPATYDNAQKLLRVNGQGFVGAVTFGAGAIGTSQPRTAHSYLPEFEAEIAKEDRLSVEDFAEKLGAFFMHQWTSAEMPPPSPGGDMIFFVGGYDENSPYGRVFEVKVPSHPKPIEKIPAPHFGAIWGGQFASVDRLINGLDPELPNAVYEFLKTPPSQRNNQALADHLRSRMASKIPWQFLPLQDCVDIAIFLVRVAMTLQRWTIEVRGVGGAIDVATITRSDGFSLIQQKEITGTRDQRSNGL